MARGLFFPFSRRLGGVQLAAMAAVRLGRRTTIG
jgi:hypothetical protein